MPTLPILHWNDVYRVNPQKVSPGSPETIDVTQFAAMLDRIRNGWALRPDGKREGLALFSGDVFSPSVESSVTRGSHMVSLHIKSGMTEEICLIGCQVPVMNELAPDVSLTGKPVTASSPFGLHLAVCSRSAGNHDFDFGNPSYQHVDCRQDT